MASMVGENWGHVDGQDWSENSELSSRNHNLLMSLLDDQTQIDECDDERLTKVIQSLQDELDSSADHFAWGSDDLVDCQSSIDDESYGQGCPSMAALDLDLHWMDVEMMPTSPSGDHMGSWCMDHHGQGTMIDDGGVNEFGFVKNNSSPFLEVEQDFWHGHFEYE